MRKNQIKQNNRIMGTPQPRLAQNQTQTSDSTSPFTKQFTNEDENKLNWFFNELEKIFGQKFGIAFPTEESEQDAKDIYGPIIVSFSKEEAIQGRQKLIASRATGGLQWLDLSEILPLFDQTQVNEVALMRLYSEYLNGGVDITRPVKHPAGHMVTQKIGIDWSVGYMREVSGRLGSGKYHESTYKHKAQKVFEKEVRAVLLEMKRGADFELPMGIEDKSQEVRPREHYQSAAKKGHSDFMKRFKR
jgi:hypothetical protein